MIYDISLPIVSGGLIYPGNPEINITLQQALAQGAGVQTIFMSRVFPAPGRLGLFIANADGSGERPLLAESGGLDYDATWSRAGDWIAFTSERGSPTAPLTTIRPRSRPTASSWCS